MRLAYITVPLGLAFACAGGALMMAAKRATPASDNISVVAQPRHPVTPEMWKQADGAKGMLAPDFKVTDTDGKAHSLADLTKDRPLFLYFVLDGCPCSIESQPHYERLHLRFRDKVNFLAVTSASLQIAKKWKSEFAVPYPAASDTKLETMKVYGVERSVYCLLIGEDQKIIKMWPGYSASMLQDVNKEIATAVGEQPKEFPPLTAPELITSGCEFSSKV
jgi:peroxiredoxin